VIEAVVARAFKEEWGRVVATLIRVTGDWDLAEECAQDAFTRALERWPSQGVPANPGAWLTTTARNRAFDRLRRASVGAAKLAALGEGVEAEETVGPAGSWIVDDRLRLIFTCCHPALPLDARVALTLRTLGGLSTAEVARAFLVSEATMAKRLVRAKAKIKHAGIPYRIPPAELLAERLDGVLAVLYLSFNEGYAATDGDSLVRQGLCDEAIRLARMVVTLMADEPEVRGALSLMLLQHSRRDARVDGDGDLVPLEEQDRGRWDRGAIEEGCQMLKDALASGRPGPYQVQAAIAACHAEAPSAADTDWVQIARLYEALARMVPSPVVELNRAVAVAMAEGPEAGLRLIDRLDDAGQLADYYLLQAARADFLRRLGRTGDAAVAYADALRLARTAPERRYLTRRLAEVGGP